MLKGNWYISNSVANGKECGCLHLLWRKPSSGETSVQKVQAIHFSHLSEQNVKLLMSQCFTCWLKRKYRKHSIIEHHYIWSLSILPFATRINAFSCPIQEDVPIRRRGGLILRNGMTLVSRKFRMTILEGVAT